MTKALRNFLFLLSLLLSTGSPAQNYTRDAEIRLGDYFYGAHFGYRYYDHYTVLNRTSELENYTFTPVIGIAGLAGLEYLFQELPFIIGVDIKPYFEFSTIQIFSIYLQSIGISLKYKY